MGSQQNAVFFSSNVELAKNCSDTALRLDGFGYGGSKSNLFGRNQNSGTHSTPPDDGCRLVLGLGPTPSTYSDKCYPSGASKKKGLSSDGDSLKLGLSAAGSDDELSNVLGHSVSVQSTMNMPGQSNRVPTSDGKTIFIRVVDEGSTSARKSGGYLTTFFIDPKADHGKMMLAPTEEQSQMSSEPSMSIVSDYSRSGISGSATSSDHRSSSNPKRCKFNGCIKGARGATGLCIGHGGGQRCQKPGCNKGAESRTAYCKAHGGGKRCQELGCTKSAEGKTDLCIAHGGGRRCNYDGGCTKAARGKSGMCIRHGGGKRCKVEGCTRSAEGQIGLCISHGGGRRCQFPGCSKGAQGSTSLCKAHGGGKRCIFAGCTKGAEGSTPLCKGHGGGKRCLYDGGGICPKSVHGGTNYCVAHGGGKRCAVSGCTKSARGRTDCCVRHGGGKRCKVENCGKSAQGSTDFCKAHGGGKRCSWGGGKCEKFARGKSGLCAAHCSLVQGQEQGSKGSMIGPGLFHGLVSATSTLRSSTVDVSYSSCGVSMMSESTAGSPESRAAKRQHLIPPQVLVPMSMKASSSSFVSGREHERIAGMGTASSGTHNGGKGLTLAGPEGRVHGGGLMSLFGGNLRNSSN